MMLPRDGGLSLGNEGGRKFTQWPLSQGRSDVRHCLAPSNRYRRFRGYMAKIASPTDTHPLLYFFSNYLRPINRPGAQWDRDPARNTMAFASMKYPPNTFPSGGAYGESTLFEQVSDVTMRGCGSVRK